MTNLITVYYNTHLEFCGDECIAALSESVWLRLDTGCLWSLFATRVSALVITLHSAHWALVTARFTPTVPLARDRWWCSHQQWGRIALVSPHRVTVMFLLLIEEWRLFDCLGQRFPIFITYPHNPFKHWQNMARNVLLLTFIVFSIFDITAAATTTTTTTTTTNNNNNIMTVLDIIIKILYNNCIIIVTIIHL